MAIPEKLLKFKYHFIAGAVVSLVFLLLVLLAPRFVDVIVYFWPLFLSTAMFLTAAVVFGWLSPIEHEVSGEKAGEGILDYVAGKPERVEEAEEEIDQETPKSEKSESKETGFESRVSDE
ncbi:uncharacterized protein LOC122059263 [Macadamia integrifolia]|uniref:uncharacterized protein LOC122059263 n=1 Tax=Macadamia integrifolia TaxID=60698 RepID=UPI001C532E19|nr:uncharacterized protein LOC122059263 [Macadamia integrifolia]